MVRRLKRFIAIAMLTLVAVINQPAFGIGFGDLINVGKSVLGNTAAQKAAESLTPALPLYVEQTKVKKVDVKNFQGKLVKLSKPEDFLKRLPAGDYSFSLKSICISAPCNPSKVKLGVLKGKNALAASQLVAKGIQSKNANKLPVAVQYIANGVPISQWEKGYQSFAGSAIPEYREQLNADGILGIRNKYEQIRAASANVLPPFDAFLNKAGIIGDTYHRMERIQLQIRQGGRSHASIFQSELASNGEAKESSWVQSDKGVFKQLAGNRLNVRITPEAFSQGATGKSLKIAGALPKPPVSKPPVNPGDFNKYQTPNNAANDNFVPEGVAAGYTVRAFFMDAAAAFAIGVGGEIEYQRWTGQTNVTWSDIFDAISHGEYRPLSATDGNSAFTYVMETEPEVQQPVVPQLQPNTAQNQQTQANQNPQTAGEYPCEDVPLPDYKLPDLARQTPEEDELWHIAIDPPVTGIGKSSYFYRNVIDPVVLSRFTRLYGGTHWEEHRVPKEFIAHGKKVFLRWFRPEGSVNEYDFQFVSECHQTPCEKFRKERADYESQVHNLAKVADDLKKSGMSLADVARNVSQQRSQIAAYFKKLTQQSFPEIYQQILNRNAGVYKDSSGPNFEDLLRKYNGSYEKLIEASSRTNSDNFVKQLEAAICKD